MDLKELAERCAGAETKEQEAFIENVLLHIMIMRYGRGANLPDGNAIPFVLEALPRLDIDFVRSNYGIITRILDAFYKYVSGMLLEDSSYDILDLRSSVEQFMVKTLQDRERNKSKASDVIHQ